MDYIFDCRNSLSCCCDWLEFTIDDDECFSSERVFYYIQYFGMNIDHFDLLEKGLMGYKSVYKHCSETIYICFNGNSNMGIHLRVSGSSVSFFYSSFISKRLTVNPFNDDMILSVDSFNESCFGLLLKSVLDIGRLTRIDLAIDDLGCNYYSLQQVYNRTKSGKFCSKFKSWNPNISYTNDGQELGFTIYFGKRVSDVFLRVYDKRLEQKVDFNWVRWELEIKHDKADVVAREIIERGSFSSVAIGILSHYLRFINLDNDNISRCSIHYVWQQFIDNCSSIPLKLPVPVPTVDRKRQWIDKQVLPTLSGLIMAYNGDTSFIYDRIEDNLLRLSPRVYDMFLDYSKK